MGDFSLFSLSWFLSGPIVLPRNKLCNIFKKNEKIALDYVKSQIPFMSGTAQVIKSWIALFI